MKLLVTIVLLSVLLLFEITISPIVLQDVSRKGKKLVFKVPLILTPEMDEDTYQLFMVEKPEICLHVFAYTRDDLIDEINKQIMMMWDEYVKSSLQTLASDAQELRQNLLNHIEEVEV